MKSINNNILFVPILTIFIVAIGACQSQHKWTSHIQRVENIENNTYQDWNIREEKSLQFIAFISQYMNDSIPSFKMKADSSICKEIINYYSSINPLDGGPGELQAGAIYDLFYMNDSLCLLMDEFMQKKCIDQNMRDTIWYRIAFDIMGAIWMEESWNENEQKTKFRFFNKNGYFIVDYDPYVKYSSLKKYKVIN